MGKKLDRIIEGITRYNKNARYEKMVKEIVRSIGVESVPDVVNHGADAGFGNFCYYADTCKFYRKYQDVIVEMAEDMAGQLGEGGVIELVQSFGVFRHDKPEQSKVGRVLYSPESKSRKRKEDPDETAIENVMAWFALEEVCRALYDENEGLPRRNRLWNGDDE